MVAPRLFSPLTFWFELVFIRNEDDKSRPALCWRLRNVDDAPAPGLQTRSSSAVFHLSSFVFRLSHFIFHLSSFIFHLSSSARRLPSAVCVLRPPFSVLRSPFSVLRSPFSVLPFSVLRSPFSVLRSPFSVLRSPFHVPGSRFPVPPHTPSLYAPITQAVGATALDGAIGINPLWRLPWQRPNGR